MDRARDHLDSIPTPILEFIALFEAELGSVRFPQVDHGSLLALAEKVRARAAAVDAIQEQLDEARNDLHAAHGELLRLAKRGLAYAKVFADGDDELTERLASVTLPKENNKPRRRRRRRVKDNDNVTTLPLVAVR